MSPDGRRVAVVAVHRGKLPADQFRTPPRVLYLVDLDPVEWHRVGGDLTEPLWFSDSARLAVQAGTGPGWIELAARELHRTRVSPMSYGPAGIALDRSETRLALVKWRTGQPMPSIWDLTPTKPTHLPTSAYSFGWWDDETLLVQPLANHPSLVNASTGRRKRFAQIGEVLDAARRSASGRLDGLEPERWTRQDGAVGGYTSLVVHEERVYFSLFAMERFRGARALRGSGIYSFDRSLGDAREHVWLDRWQIRSFMPYAAGAVCWLHAEQGGPSAIDHLMAWAGAKASMIPDGFEPIVPRGHPDLLLHSIWDPRRPKHSVVLRAVH